MQDSAADYFGSLVLEYDSLIRRAVPRYDDLLERLLAYAPAEPSRILELGSGTGNLSVELRRRYPRAELTCVDASREMLAITRSRLAGLSGLHEPKTVEARFESLELGGAAFDFVTSCISLHHVRDKTGLCRSIHAGLAPGGVFLFADQLRGADPHTHDVHWRRWLDFCREPDHCAEAEIESLLEHARAHDHYASLDDHWCALHEAGFVDLDCVWRDGMWAILYARARGA